MVYPWPLDDVFNNYPILLLPGLLSTGKGCYGAPVCLRFALCNLECSIDVSIHACLIIRNVFLNKSSYLF